VDKGADADAVNDALNDYADGDDNDVDFGSGNIDQDDLASLLADGDNGLDLGKDLSGDDVTDALAHSVLGNDADYDDGDIASALNAGGFADSDDAVVGSLAADVEHSTLLGFIDNTELTIPDNPDAQGVDGDDGATSAFPDDAALPGGTTYDFADAGAGFANVYTYIPADEDGGGGLQDILVTPFGNTDLTPLADIVALISPESLPGSPDIDPSDLLNDLGSAFGM
jgi:hypothetical protein